MDIPIKLSKEYLIHDPNGETILVPICDVAFSIMA